MARTRLGTEAVEQSSYVITLGFLDAAGNLVTPDSASWTLSTAAGTVINGREEVTISPLAATVTIVLSGADLALVVGDNAPARRLLTVEATYSSDEGAALPLRDEYEFAVRHLALVG
jgi:putative intracellular protease/amidase